MVRTKEYAVQTVQNALYILRDLGCIEQEDVKAVATCLREKMNKETDEDRLLRLSQERTEARIRRRENERIHN